MFLRKSFAYFAVLAGSAMVYSICWAAPAMVEKNLFSQDRKAPSPDTAVGPSQPAKPGMPITNLQLDGVLFQGDTRKALVRLKSQAAGASQKKGQQPYVIVRENQQVSDFRVVKIEPKSIMLEKDGQTFVLSLFADGKVVVPAAVPQPAQAAGVPAHVLPGQQPGVGQVMQPQQPGAPVQPGAVNLPDPGIIDPTLMLPPPEVVSNSGQTVPEAAVLEQVPPPEEEPPQ